MSLAAFITCNTFFLFLIFTYFFLARWTNAWKLKFVLCVCIYVLRYKKKFRKDTACKWLLEEQTRLCSLKRCNLRKARGKGKRFSGVWCRKRADALRLPSNWKNVITRRIKVRETTSVTCVRRFHPSCRRARSFRRRLSMRNLNIDGSIHRSTSVAPQYSATFRSLYCQSKKDNSTRATVSFPLVVVIVVVLIVDKVRE